MSFFEPPPRTPPEPVSQPEWLGPADNVLPSPFPLWLELARTNRVAIHIHAGNAYPNGFGFLLTLRLREQRRGVREHPFHGWHEAWETGVIPDEALRFGIEFADGSKATVFGGHRFFAATDRPEGPVLIQRGGGGGMHTWEMRFWTWPLPPAGSVAFVAEWPAEAIELTRGEIDGAVIRAAAEQAETLWPGSGILPDPGVGGTSQFQIG